MFHRESERSRSFYKWGTAFCFLMLASCSSLNDISPDDAQAGYAVPVTRPFTLPEAKPIDWKIISPDSMPAKNVIRFDINKLPTRPFTANEFRPLKKPAPVISFDMNKLPVVALNDDSLNYQPVGYRKFVMPKAEIFPAAIPSLPSKGNAGLTRLSVSEGLAGNKIFAIQEDADGSTWISTDRGLVKYTGEEFHLYQFFERDEGTGSLEAIPALRMDSLGRLLAVGTKSGLYRIDTKAGIVEHFRGPFGFTRIGIDGYGRVWGIQGGVGMLHMDLEKRRFAKLPIYINGIENNEHYNIHADSEGNTWLAMNKTIRYVGS